MKAKAALLTGALPILLSGIMAAANGAGTTPGEDLFLHKCGICHLAGKTGAQMLERRLGKDLALLHERKDLAGAYIGTVVRQGLAGMPPLTRVELPDAELDSIVRYLTRSRSSADGGAGHE
ncbi:MAG: cytochrome c [Gammaproteobacteria bacterium]|nr:MAG: cytochrome c [Gammaproteobacteria bacterium]